MHYFSCFEEISYQSCDKCWKLKEEWKQLYRFVGEISLNLNKLTVKKNNKISKINPAEKKLLEKMISSSGKIFPRREIGKIINTTKERTVDVMITRLRQKIEPDPKKPKYLQTIRGSGYVLWIE